MMFGNQNKIAAQPFVWGMGGARLSPEQLQMQQQDATQRQQVDYSPIQSPWQGLARVANNLVGALQQKQLNKEYGSVQADRQKSVAALLAPDAGGGGEHIDPVAQALASPYPEVQQLGMAVWKQRNPAPVNNDTVADYNFRVQTLGKDAADEWLKRGGDPFVTATLPGGNFYAGPQSGFAAAMGGGVPAALVPSPNTPVGSPLMPSRPVGKLTPIEGDR